MPFPIAYAIGVGLMTAGRFILPRLASTGMSLLRGTGTAAKAVVSNPVTNNPIKSALVAGAANKATDGAVGEAALRVGEGAVAVAGAVVGREAVASAGTAALGALSYAGEGLAQVGVSAVERYGPDALDALPTVLPKGLGAVVATVKGDTKPAEEPVRDVVAEGGITVDDATRASTAFREKAEEVAGEGAELAQKLAANPFTKKMLALGDDAMEEAKTNPWIWAGLMMGGYTGAKKADGKLGMVGKPLVGAIFTAAIFAMIGHHFFGQRSELAEKATNSLSEMFGNMVEGFNGPSASNAISIAGFTPQRRPSMAPVPSLS